MSDEESTPGMTNTDLAFERTQLALERTLMAWVRTAVSMISFGFTMYKVFQEMSKDFNVHHQRLLTPRIVGMIMILFALIGLLFAQIQHYIAIKELRKNYPRTRKSMAAVLSALIFAFGLVLLVAIFFRQ